MIDYSEILATVQRALALRVIDNPELVNVPGKSLACKVDLNYYLAPSPQFVDTLAAWTELRADLVRETLVRTGDIITNPEDRGGELSLEVGWGDKRTRLTAVLLHAACIDRALQLYASTEGPLPVSDLRIAQAHREELDVFLEGKSPLEPMAYI